MSDNFVDIPFTYDNLDRYVARTSILEAIKTHLPLMRGRLLDAGCGKMPYKRFISENSAISEYVGLDIETALPYDAAVVPDFRWDGKTMPFEAHAFDSVMATEVLEHCPDPNLFLREVRRVLRPDGLFFFTVPFLWNLHEVPHDEYRYTPFSLERHLRCAGFSEVNIRALGGWHASLAQLLGLWVRRSGMSVTKQRMLSVLIKPVMQILLRKAADEQVRFIEGSMITGLSGYARGVSPSP